MRKIVAILTLFYGLSASAQNALKSYQWRDHLPYNIAYSVTNQGHKILAAANECAFSYDKDADKYERLNKVSGYSDIEPVIIKNNPYNNTLLIIYKNSNIDVVKNGSVTNASDLLRKQNIGDKSINSITFRGPLAYLACGFGIVVFNTETMEFKDEYIIGPNATNVKTYQVALTDTSIYAATDKGLFRASLSATNLSSFTSWSRDTVVPGKPVKPFNGVVYFGQKVIVSYSKFIDAGAYREDTLFQFDGTSWSKYPFNGVIDGISKISVSDDNSNFIIIDTYGFEAYDPSGAVLIRYWGDLYYVNSWQYVNDVIPDPTESGTYWIADRVYGLYKVKGVALVDPIKNYKINGPTKASATSFDIKDDKVIVAPSYLDYYMGNSYLPNEVFHFEDNAWGEATKIPNDTTLDINAVAFDINDKNHYFGSSWFNGVVEYVNDVEVARYNYRNTNKLLYPDTISNLTRCGGMTIDKDNNLWVGMGETQHCLSARKSDGTWGSLDFSSINSIGSTSGAFPRIRHVMVDSSKQVWAVAYSIGLFVYKFDGNFPLVQPNPSNAKRLNNIVGNGGLPSNEVISIAEDKNGDIWVGTDKGVYVFYNPETIFTQPSGWDAQPIYIQQDGKTQLLLQTDEVVCIAVDGANNKWFGTRSSGLYCFSPDGQKQLFHFTIDNSPLFSNNILDVKVNPKTGEVFIATDKGMLSYQNTIIEGVDDFKGAYAYPNPVKPNYDGPILIHGMINGATVKVLDAAGNFVYQTTSEGGQAQWDGKNFHGNRVASGVYLVLCSTPDGQARIMTKILLLN